MSDPQGLSTEEPSFWSRIFTRKMLVALTMGFSSGLPLLLTITVLQAWMKEEKVDLTVIGAMALVGLPYSLKFLWSPILDRFTLPLLGRRRGWLLCIQILLTVAIVFLGLNRPSANLGLVVLAAFLVTFFSASQDIVIDAYRREDLEDEELGLGSSLAVNGYRVGMLLASGGGLILAGQYGFRVVYFIMAAFMSIGIVTTLLTPEPAADSGRPRTLRETVIEPLHEFFSRSRPALALLLLAFILFYKIGDQMASNMTTPFYLDIGFSTAQIGAIVKLFGFWAIIVGSLVGGAVMLRLGIIKSLWIFGVGQAVSTAGFAVLYYIGAAPWGLAVVITVENFTGGMGTAAYVAFMASLTNKRFTATQYALLTSLMAVPRVIIAAPTGWMAKAMGWPGFFIFCTLIAVPGLLMLIVIGREHVTPGEGGEKRLSPGQALFAKALTALGLVAAVAYVIYKLNIIAAITSATIYVVYIFIILQILTNL